MADLPGGAKMSGRITGTMYGPEFDMLYSLLEAADDNTKHAAIDLLRIYQTFSSNPNASQFLNRSVQALQRVLELSEPSAIKSSLGAPSDILVLYQALASPTLLEKLTEDDPLTGARMRGAIARSEILGAEGGTISGEELADLTGVSRQTIDNRRKAGAILAFSHPNKRGYLYPRWQVSDGQLLSGLDEVLGTLEEFGPWVKAQFILEPNRWLDWSTPLQALRIGHVKEAVQAAEAFSR